jgi:hypothetical protein
MPKSQRKSELRLGDALLIGSTTVKATHSITDCLPSYCEFPYQPTQIDSLFRIVPGLLIGPLHKWHRPLSRRN